MNEPFNYLKQVRYVINISEENKYGEVMCEFLPQEKDEQAVFSNEIHWFPALNEYDPGITTEKWLDLLKNKSLIGGDYVWARVLAVFYAENGNAVPSVLNREYGYNGSLLQYCTNIARSVRSLTDCPVYRDKEYWTILFQSESADNGKAPWYRRRLRPELYEALTQINISRYLPEKVIISDLEQKQNGNPEETSKVIIDTSFDFTTDAHGKDPDSYSETLQRYHQKLWSKELPCGEKMQLVCCGSGPYCLTWNQHSFASDAIIVGFRYHARYAKMIRKIRSEIPDWYDEFDRTFNHRSYTIGGMTIFPKHMNSINQMKGFLVCDRWDLTLECIRRYYKGEDSPLYKFLLADKFFFDLFVDFKGYVDYFFFQDCVTDDYSRVIFWYGNGSFKENKRPQSAADYKLWIERELDFLDKRNERIKNSLLQSG